MARRVSLSRNQVTGCSRALGTGMEMAQLLRGAEVAQALDAETAARIEQLCRKGVVPTLGIVRASERRDCTQYVRSIRSRCEGLGIRVLESVLAEDASEEKVLEAVTAFADDALVHGIVVCQPLPAGVRSEAVLNAVPVEKDVDGTTVDSLMRAYNGHGRGFYPCAPEAVMRILRHYEIELHGRDVVVIGNSQTVGMPICLLLLQAWATPTSCNIYTHDVAKHTQGASVVISATGATDFFGAEYFRPGQTVVDVGVGFSERLGRLSGDVRFDEVEPLVGAITPAPGGVGTVCSSIMANHVALAACVA